MGTLLVSGWCCVPASVRRGSLRKVLTAAQDWRGGLAWAAGSPSSQQFGRVIRAMNSKHAHASELSLHKWPISHKRKRGPVVSAPQSRPGAMSRRRWVKGRSVSQAGAGGGRLSFSAHVALSNREEGGMFLYSRHPGMPGTGEGWCPPSTESC